ncbi:hypothetical protein K3725_11515 [Leisingera sp. S132]|uniref:hypothetical protein n=1 Tax=Leisingera sp. S132 TaxID=2867016 RepID=UPI0021A7D255|nr:hypothetical protein [Leisingera sp. S132]UWQ77945.1 hypothetical protein K3725_11515 [Leisingera sp. S132]
MKFIAIGGVVLLLLAVAKGLLPDVFHFLPLGGSTVAEMGVVFGVAVAAAAINDLRRANDE